MRTTAVRIVPLMALMVPFLYAPSSRGGQNDIRQSVVKVLARDANVLVVRGMDMVDGTPIFDIKPFITKATALPRRKRHD